MKTKEGAKHLSADGVPLSLTAMGVIHLALLSMESAIALGVEYGETEKDRSDFLKCAHDLHTTAVELGIAK